MVSGAYNIGQIPTTRVRPDHRARDRIRPQHSPPLPPATLILECADNPPPSPPPRLSSSFNYLPDTNNFDFRRTKTGPGRLPIYRAESPTTPEDDQGCVGGCGCRARRGVSLASALLTAAAALLALLLVLGAITYFLLLADASPEQSRSRHNNLEAVSSSSSSVGGVNTNRGAVAASTPKERATPVPPLHFEPTVSGSSDSTLRPKEPASTSPSPLGHDDEPLFKDIVVSYQPYQPPSASSGDVVTAGFVPHWFREEVANTDEVRASTPNRFTSPTPPVHVSPTLPSAVSSPGGSSFQNNTSESLLCHSPRLEACRGVLPYDLTTLSGGAGSASASLEAAAGALGFAHVARGACRLAARQLLCALLEPPCQPDDRVLPPCRTACLAAVSECGEFLLATLGLGSEFDCSRYPEASARDSCVDLTKDCDAPRVRCASSGACVPSQWRCDGRDDCSDNSDERDCRNILKPVGRSHPASSSRTQQQQQQPTCRPGQARCLDGECIEATHLCDGRHHCSRGEDEAVCPPS